MAQGADVADDAVVTAEAPDAAELAAPRPADLAPTPHDVELQRAHRLLYSARDAVANMFRDARMGRAIDRQVMQAVAAAIADSVTRNGGRSSVWCV